MEKSFYCLVLCLGLILKEQYTKETQVIEKILETISLPKSVKKIFIIPVDGCSGCVQKMKLSIIKKQQSTNEIFILTSPSKKSMKIYSANIPKKNIVFDTKKLALNEEIVTIYPIVFSLFDGKIIKSDIIDANNIDNF